MKKYIIVLEALEYARAAHESIGQVRKISGLPYIVHPISVAKFVRRHGGSAEQIAAALLHDVCEDVAGIELRMIGQRFGSYVRELVEGLTNVATKSDGYRGQRNAINLAHLLFSNPDVQLIKYGDIWDNIRHSHSMDPQYMRDVYLPEKLTILTHAVKGPESARLEAMKVVEELSDYFYSRNVDGSALKR